MRTSTRFAAAALVAASLGLPTASAAPTADCLSGFHGLDLQTVTIPQLEAAMAAGTFTSRQLTQAYLNRIAAFDLGPVKVNAIRAITGDALAQADAADAARAAGRSGPLLGIPLLLKDNIDTTDAPTTAGSIALAGNTPKAPAPLVAQLQGAGAVILGKTNLSEFANWMSEGMPNGYSSLGGQVVNPYNQGDPSGSSSGSGAGGTLAFAAATFGTETSGSILSPSTANSMVGIKPTVGLVSRNGIIPLAHSFDTAGPIARDVTDAASLLGAVTAYDAADVIDTPAAGRPSGPTDYTRVLDPTALRGARIGYSSQDAPDGAAGAVWAAALAQLQADGATLVEVAPAFDPNDPQVSSVANLPTEQYAGLGEVGEIPEEFHNNLNNYLATTAGPEGTGPGQRPVLTTDDLTGIIAYNQGYPNQVKYGQSLLIASDANDGATQTHPGAPATILAARQAIDGSLAHYGLSAYVAPDASYANAGAAAGYPSVTVPDGYTPATVGQDAHGIQFLGTAYSEPTLIGLAYAYEQSSHQRVPATTFDPAITSATCPAGPTAALPEAPVAVGLPAAAGLAGWWLLRRRRRAVTA